MNDSNQEPYLPANPGNNLSVSALDFEALDKLEQRVPGSTQRFVEEELKDIELARKLQDRELTFAEKEQVRESRNEIFTFVLRILGFLALATVVIGIILLLFYNKIDAGGACQIMVGFGALIGALAAAAFIGKKSGDNSAQD